MSAGEALAAAVMSALAAVEALNGRFDGPPLQGAVPYATVETGLESDWGHKSGAGREVRLTVTIRDAGERPERLRRLAGEAEAAVAGMAEIAAGWRIVTLVLLRSKIVAEGGGRWAAAIDFRARMLAE